MLGNAEEIPIRRRLANSPFISTCVGAPVLRAGPLTWFALPVGIALFQSSYRSEFGLTLAASVLCTLPVIIVFLVLQKHIIRGIALTGLKE